MKYKNSEFEWLLKWLLIKLQFKNHHGTFKDQVTVDLLLLSHHGRKGHLSTFQSGPKTHAGNKCNFMPNKKEPIKHHTREAKTRPRNSWTGTKCKWDHIECRT